MCLINQSLNAAKVKNALFTWISCTYESGYLNNLVVFKDYSMANVFSLFHREKDASR